MAAAVEMGVDSAAALGYKSYADGVFRLDIMTTIGVGDAIGVNHIILLADRISLI